MGRAPAAPPKFLGPPTVWPRATKFDMATRGEEDVLGVSHAPISKGRALKASPKYLGSPICAHSHQILHSDQIEENFHRVDRSPNPG